MPAALAPQSLATECILESCQWDCDPSNCVVGPTVALCCDKRQAEHTEHVARPVTYHNTLVSGESQTTSHKIFSYQLLDGGISTQSDVCYFVFLRCGCNDVQALCTLGALACVASMALHELLSRTPNALAAAAESAMVPKARKNPNPVTAFKCDPAIQRF